MSSDTFDQVPWSSFPADSDSDKILAWHKTSVPYVSKANALQNLELWIPVHDKQPQGSSEPRPTDALKRPGRWIVYIHGGAWRDPLVTSSSFTASVQHILSSQSSSKQQIAGLASINYPLSPHPAHPTHPAPQPAPGVETDPSRSAKHPDHILNVLSALEFLESRYGFGSNYVLTGHSCGATLALQVAMRDQWSTQSSTSHGTIPQPAVIVGLNGLYDLPALIQSPGEKHQHLAGLYETFTRSAFGDDPSVWKAVSPTSVTDWGKTWPTGRHAILVQSREDTLVPYSQTGLMFENLRSSQSGGLQIGEMEAGGDHNELWEKGDRLAEILLEVLEKTS